MSCIVYPEVQIQQKESRNQLHVNQTPDGLQAQHFEIFQRSPSRWRKRKVSAGAGGSPASFPRLLRAHHRYVGQRYPALVQAIDFRNHQPVRPLVPRQGHLTVAQGHQTLAPAPAHPEAGLKAHRARKGMHDLFQRPLYPFLSLRYQQGAVVVEPNHYCTGWRGRFPG